MPNQENRMANYKRRKPKQQVRCTLCTEHRWKGNKSRSDGRFKSKDHARLKEMEREMRR